MNGLALPSPHRPPVLAAWALFALGLWLMLPLGPDLEAASARVAGGAPLVLHADRHGQYRATGHVDGVPAHFLVDTGAADVVVPEGLARAAGLPFGTPLLYRGPTGPVRAWRSRIRTLRLGAGLVLHDVPAAILPGEGREVLLGMSALRHLSLTQRRGRLVLAAE